MEHKLLTLKAWPIFALSSCSLFSIDDKLPLKKKKKKENISSPFFLFFFTIDIVSRSGNERAAYHFYF